MQPNKLIKFFIAVVFLNFLFLLDAKAFVVYDPTNWIQNAATAANTAKQLAKQSQELEIALKEIKNYDGSVGRWANIQNLLQELGNEIEQGESLAYGMPFLDSRFKQKYPGYVESQNYQKAYAMWSQTALDTMRATLESVGMQASQFSSEQSALDELSILSHSAQGRMQALQVGNMLATQQIAQLQKLRQLVMVQVNAENTFASYQIQKDQNHEVSSSNWISGSKTEFPRYGSGHNTVLKELPPIY
jgi:P-type conjugative transfer protein TrbJ